VLSDATKPDNLTLGLFLIILPSFEGGRQRDGEIHPHLDPPPSRERRAEVSNLPWRERKVRMGNPSSKDRYHV